MINFGLRRIVVISIGVLLFCGCSSFYSYSNNLQTKLSSPFSIEIVDRGQNKGLLEIKSEVFEAIEIEIYLTCNLRSGFLAHHRMVSKNQFYQSLFLNVTEQSYVPTIKDYKGKAELVVSYSYKGKPYKERVGWDIFVPKESLGEPKAIYAQDGLVSWWVDISRFTAVKISHEIEEAHLL